MRAGGGATSVDSGPATSRASIAANVPRNRTRNSPKHFWVVTFLLEQRQRDMEDGSTAVVMHVDLEKEAVIASMYTGSVLTQTCAIHVKSLFVTRHAKRWSANERARGVKSFDAVKEWTNDGKHCIKSLEEERERELGQKAGGREGGRRKRRKKNWRKMTTVCAKRIKWQMSWIKWELDAATMDSCTECYGMANRMHKRNCWRFSVSSRWRSSRHDKTKTENAVDIIIFPWKSQMEFSSVVLIAVRQSRGALDFSRATWITLWTNGTNRWRQAIEEKTIVQRRLYLKWTSKRSAQTQFWLCALRQLKSFNFMECHSDVAPHGCAHFLRATRGRKSHTHTHIANGRKKVNDVHFAADLINSRQDDLSKYLGGSFHCFFFAFSHSVCSPHNGAHSPFPDNNNNNNLQNVPFYGVGPGHRTASTSGLRSLLLDEWEKYGQKSAFYLRFQCSCHRQWLVRSPLSAEHIYLVCACLRSVRRISIMEIFFFFYSFYAFVEANPCWCFNDPLYTATQCMDGKLFDNTKTVCTRTVRTKKKEKKLI